MLDVHLYAAYAFIGVVPSQSSTGTYRIGRVPSDQKVSGLGYILTVLLLVSLASTLA
jgi:hypothetical protein